MPSPNRALPATTDTNAEFPDKLDFLFRPSRYKVMRGGRGSAKSWSAARALVIRSAGDPKLRVLCAREVQNSIKDSVHRLLSDQIAALNLGYHFDVQAQVIKRYGGGDFNFEGLRFNIADLKSFEGADICWVEEAQTTSKASWTTLIPTIRKEGSEIWVTFNPVLETDDTYVRFVKTQPPGCVSVEINWRDNPWFPKVLRTEMEHMMATDYDEYLHVWEGKCKQTLDGAIYAEELRAATKGNRITRVPYDEATPVDCFWDLGHADFTSIWFSQWVAKEHRVLDFYQNQFKKLQHYIKVLREKPYAYGRMWLPHDAKAERLGSDKTIQAQVEMANFTVEIVPNLSVVDGIAAGRALFSQSWIDNDNCADGLNCLRRYRYKLNENTGQYSDQPLHDDASHPADAWRYMGIASSPAKPKKNFKTTPGVSRGGKYDWMAG
jgi:phage terminase large subunit